MIKNDLAIFEDHKIRRIYDKENDTWFFSVVDVVQVLTQQADYQTGRKYWSVLKTRLKKEGSESTTKCSQLKLKTPDGKKYLTDVANVETLLRLIQSIPSPKVEPFKLWLAKVGYERIQEIADPERSLNRARDNWSKQGRSNEWIQRRMSGYKIKLHDIRKLGSLAENYNAELWQVFPHSSVDERQAFKLLERAYIEARYNKEYKISREQLTFLIERVNKLQNLTERICLEYINAS